MKNYTVLALLAGAALLSACSTQQVALMQTDTAALCSLANEAAAADPALAKHNPKGAALGAATCAAAPSAIALLPIKAPAPAASPAT